jgi:hypothetical protein
MCTPYWQKIINLFGANLIGYYPLWENVGSGIAQEISYGNVGYHIGVELGHPGKGDGKTAAYFNNVPSYVSLNNPNFYGKFSGAAGSMIFWAQAASAGLWSDGVERSMDNWARNASNWVHMRKGTGANTVFLEYRAGGVTKTITYTDISPGTNFFTFGITWSKSADEVKGYYYGSQKGSTQTGLGTWLGTGVGDVGDSEIPGAYPWLGCIQDAIFVDRVATPAEMLEAATL